MSIFLYFVVIGLVGLVFMAVPGLFRHGHVGASGHGIGHAGQAVGGHAIGHAAGGHVGHAAGGHAASTGHAASAHTPAAQGQAASNGNATTDGPPVPIRLIPSPRMIFSLLALYGAFGYALQPYTNTILAACMALAPAAAIERFIVTPLWNMMFRMEGKASSPIEALVFSEAEAVTPFRNGKGLVAVERDGRMVQFSARLPEGSTDIPIQVGDRLRIEEVDAANERVTVTLH